MAVMEYDIGYKYLQINVKDRTVIIELGFDTMMGKSTFTATSNFLFLDDEIWGHAVGVGNTEQNALNMCIVELQNYIGEQIASEDFSEIADIPKRLTVSYGKKKR